MANHFHDINGWLLVGIDRHAGVHWPTPIPLPMLFFELNVMHPFVLGGNQAGTVHFNGVNAVKDQHNPKLLWPHFPFAPDPLNLLFPLDLVFGDHKCWLSRGSVLTEGSPAPICAIFGPLSVNLDCWMVGHLPTSLVLQAGTVETTPSLADYARCALRAAIQFAIEYVMYRLTRGKTYSGNKSTSYSKLGTNVRAIFSRENRGLASKASLFVGSGRKTVTNIIAKKLGEKLNPIPKSIPSAMDRVSGIVGFDPGGLATGGGVASMPKSPWDAAKRLFPPAGVGDAGVGVVEGHGGFDPTPPLGSLFDGHQYS